MILGRNIPEVWFNSLAESTVVMALVCPYEQPALKGRQVALSAGDWTPGCALGLNWGSGSQGLILRIISNANSPSPRRPAEPETLWVRLAIGF